MVGRALSLGLSTQLTRRRRGDLRAAGSPPSCPEGFRAVATSVPEGEDHETAAASRSHPDTPLPLRPTPARAPGVRRDAGQHSHRHRRPRLGRRPTLLSQGSPATASSTENAGTPASAAVDGNTGTRWSSAFSDPQWLQVDLGATRHHQPGRAALGGRLRQGVPDPDLRPTAPPGRRSTRTTTGTGGTQTLTVTGTGRYVRMYGTARATGYGYSLWEFQVYGETGGSHADLRRHQRRAGPARPPPRPPRTPALPASAAVDGNAGTRWSSAASDPQWLQVDLGSTAHRSARSCCSWEAAYARAFQLQVSADGATWTTIYSTTTGTGGTQTLDRHRHRPLRADVRHRPGHRLRLLAVGVQAVDDRPAAGTGEPPVDADRPAQPEPRPEHLRLRPVARRRRPSRAG